MAWNSYPGSAIKVDAVWNVSITSATTYATQKYLRKVGYYTTAYLLDGKFGPATAKAIQRYLAARGKYEGKYTGRIDGDMGPMTRNCMASYLAPGGGTPKVFYKSQNAPRTWPDYILTHAWQQYLNYRR